MSRLIHAALISCVALLPALPPEHAHYDEQYHVRVVHRHFESHRQPGNVALARKPFSACVAAFARLPRCQGVKAGGQRANRGHLCASVAVVNSWERETRASKRRL